MVSEKRMPWKIDPTTASVISTIRTFRAATCNLSILITFMLLLDQVVLGAKAERLDLQYSGAKRERGGGD